jgi:Family of unknown function (DUF6445)
MRLPLHLPERRRGGRAFAMSFEFALNRDAKMSLHAIGRERQAVMVIDGVMCDARALVDYAANGDGFLTVERGGYPGVRAPAPLRYVERLTRTIDPFVQQAFALKDVKLAKAECSFSIVTTPPDELAPAQRIPHIDTTYPLQFALLHFLCDGDFGGTGFYRHCASGYESLSEERNPHYETIAAQEAMTSPPSGYIGSGAPYYEQIAAFGAQFDRVLVYRSCALHCGLIPPMMPLIAEPRRGRLTANIFITYSPK